MFARTVSNEIYSWGQNNLGQLGRGFVSSNYEKPSKISALDGKQIINISCGSDHCLALTSNGDVYGWGSNSYGQVGCKSTNDKISSPVLIEIKNTCNINCFGLYSFTIDFNGKISYWGKMMTYFAYFLKHWRKTIIFSNFQLFRNFNYYHWI